MCERETGKRVGRRRGGGSSLGGGFDCAVDGGDLLETMHAKEALVDGITTGVAHVFVAVFALPRDWFATRADRVVDRDLPTRELEHPL